MTLFAVTFLSMYVQLPILVVVISIVYSATRYDEWGSIFVEAYRWGSRMAVFLLGIGLVLWLISYYLKNPASAP